MNTHIKKKDLEEYYIFSLRWLSDFDFFENELHFFRKILQNNILFSAGDKQLDIMLQYQNQLSEIISDEHSIRAAVLDYMKNLVNSIKNSIPEREQENKKDYERLRSRIASFVNRYRLYKDQLYDTAKASSENIESDLIVNA